MIDAVREADMMSAPDALQAASRELTRLLSLVATDDDHHVMAVETMGRVAIALRACAEHLRPH